MAETILPKGPEPVNGYPAIRISARQIAGAAQRGGFSSTKMVGGQTELVLAVAIALGESSGNIVAHNKIPPDDSYGLWQINMIGELGKSRRDRFGIKNNNELYDPTRNAQAAYHVFKSSGGFSPWSVYKTYAYVPHLVTAKRAILAGPQEPPAWKSSYDDSGGVRQNEPVAPDMLATIFDPLLNFLSEGALRAAGFVGGAALIVGGFVLLKNKGFK